MKTLIYRFTRYTFGSMELTRMDERYNEERQRLWSREYNRFVQLANSGNYAVEILDSDFGVAWELRRKVKK